MSRCYGFFQELCDSRDRCGCACHQTPSGRVAVETRADRKPLPPDVLVSALQDAAHTDRGPSRPVAPKRVQREVVVDAVKRAFGVIQVYEDRKHDAEVAAWRAVWGLK